MNELREEREAQLKRWQRMGAVCAVILALLVAVIFCWPWQKASRASDDYSEIAARLYVLSQVNKVPGGPVVFKVVALGAGTTETTIWTPATGKKFRLMGYVLTVGAGSTMTFKDNTGGATIFASRSATDQAVTVDLGNGILSGAVNNVLTVTRGTSATLDGVVWGTEDNP